MVYFSGGGGNLPPPDIKTEIVKQINPMLHFSELKKRNLLSSETMSNVRGGSGTCGYKLNDGSWKYGVSKAEALDAVSSGGRWCCDSCWKVMSQMAVIRE